MNSIRSWKISTMNCGIIGSISEVRRFFVIAMTLV